MAKGIVTTEQTAKRWKLAQLIGVVGILIGATWFFVLIGNRPEQMTPSENDAYTVRMASAICIVALGLIVWIVGRVGGWWYHG